jgi:hypothetical protein
MISRGRRCLLSEAARRRRPEETVGRWRNVAVLSHGLTKEREVPPAEIDRAIARKRMFEMDPNGHCYEETEED